MSEPKQITELFAWVATEADGGEGVCGYATNMGWMPMIGADQARIKSLRPQAMTLARELGAPVRLLRFSTMTVLEELPITKRR